MPQKRVILSTSETNTKSLRPALSPEARENQMISLATDLAEKQLLEGTASSQVICHYLKMGAEREKAALEKDILREQKKCIHAKTESLTSAKDQKILVEEAINAFRKYSGQNSEMEDVILIDENNKQ